MTLEQRRAYADELQAVGHLTSARLVDALARVRREHFLGAGPWQIARMDPAEPYRLSADGDPRHLYHDVPVAIDAERQLNNGQPSALARWIEAAAIEPGQAVLHVGCGTGYYTAIMAELAGPAGRVVAYEIDAGLAARAAQQLAGWPQVAVEAADGGEPRGEFDAIFINAGATYVRASWLAALRPGGRLIVPLTVNAPFPLHRPGLPLGIGVMMKIARADAGWPASVITPVGMYDCANARDPDSEAVVKELLRGGKAGAIRRAVVEPHDRSPDCLAHLPGLCLQG